MKTVIEAMLDEIKAKAVEISHKGHQSIHNEGDKNDGNYYITLEQLDRILRGSLESNRIIKK